MALKDDVLNHIKDHGPVSWQDVVRMCGSRSLYADTIIQTGISKGVLTYEADMLYHWQEPRPPRVKAAEPDEFDSCPEYFHKVPSY